jgi:hypothetical protein
MKAVVLAFALCFGCLTAMAHRDRWLTLRSDGSIAELPEQYGATRLYVSYLGGYPPAVADLSFQSNGKQTVVPRCLLELIQPTVPDGLKLSGSWHHDETLLPHYVTVHFKGNSNLPRPTDVDFLFSLRDARLLEVTKVADLGGGPQAVQRTAVVLKDGCPS